MNNVTPLHRGVVRPATNDQGMILGEPVDLYDTFAERERINRVVAETERDLRILWWQAFVRNSCIAFAVLAAVIFMFQLGRGAL
jgi:predicted CoA-binding protein